MKIILCETGQYDTLHMNYNNACYESAHWLYYKFQRKHRVSIGLLFSWFFIEAGIKMGKRQSHSVIGKIGDKIL